MPMQPKKRCGYPGCPRTTRQRFCDEHLRIARRFIVALIMGLERATTFHVYDWRPLFLFYEDEDRCMG